MSMCNIEIPRRKQRGMVLCSEEEDSNNNTNNEWFRMYEFKIRRCNRSRSHDWTECPFAHPGEKARRRDPRRHKYKGECCPEYRDNQGTCSKGESCEFAHGVFECWLHPSRYRTEPCKDGRHCKRKVCFFAHSLRQLRNPTSPNKHQNQNQNHLCPYSYSYSSSSSSSSPPASPLADLVSSLEALHFSASERNSSLYDPMPHHHSPDPDIGWVYDLLT